MFSGESRKRPVTWNKLIKIFFLFFNHTRQFFPQLFHDGDSHYIWRETSPLIFSANQWAGFYIMIVISVVKGFKEQQLLESFTQAKKSNG